MLLVMRKTVWLLIFAYTTVCLAQTEKPKSASKPKPNLSGVWIQDKSRSQISEYDFLSEMDLTLVISQNEPEIRITRKLFSEGDENRQELLYFSDQRGEVNPAIIEGETIKSKTKWDDETLVSRASMRRMFAAGVVVTYDRVDEWKLSRDGQTLTQTTRTYNLRSSNNKPIIIPEARNVPPIESSAKVTRKVFRKASKE
jgi:hypothetical protein